MLAATEVTFLTVTLALMKMPVGASLTNPSNAMKKLERL